MLKLNKIALTGSSGMVGSHMKRLFIYSGIEVVDLNRDVWNLSEWRSVDQIENIIGNVDAFFHCAALVPNDSDYELKELYDVNVRSCLNIAQWSLAYQKPLLYISGATVYKNPNKKNIKESDPKVVNGLGGFYGFSKYLSEMIFQHFIKLGLQVIIVRPTSVYGRGLHPKKVIMRFIKSAEVSTPIQLEQMNNSVNFIHALDVARASMSAMQNSAWGVYNIPGPEMLPFNELAQLCVTTLGQGQIISPNGRFIDGWKRFDLNGDRAWNAFGFHPQISMKKGLQLLIGDNYGI